MFEQNRIMDPDLHPTPTALLTRTRQVHAIRTAADAELAQLACVWADAHPDRDEQPPRVPARLGPDWVADPPAGLSVEDADVDPLIPGVDWAAGASFAAAVGMSTQAGEGLIRDALTLRHRLPQVWARVVALAPATSRPEEQRMTRSAVRRTVSIGSSSSISTVDDRVARPCWCCDHASVIPGSRSRCSASSPM